MITIELLLIIIGILLSISFSVYYFSGIIFNQKLTKKMIDQILLDITFYSQRMRKTESKRQKNYYKKKVDKLRKIRKLMKDVYF